MGRVRPAWMLNRMADAAEARENYRRNNPPNPNQPYNARGATDTVYYRSMTLLDNDGDPQIFRFEVLSSTLAIVSAAQAGLLTTLPVGAIDFSPRNQLKPNRARWYRGAATPAAETTAWGTRYIRYSEADTASGVTHRSIPLSVATGTVTPGDIRDTFRTLFNNNTTRLGNQNGRAYLTWETSSVGYNT